MKEIITTVEQAEEKTTSAVQAMQNRGAEIVAVRSDDDYAMAAVYLKDVAQYKKSITEYFAGIKKAAHEAWKAIVAKENEAIKPVDAEDKRIRGIMIEYKREQDRLAEIERRRAEAEREAEKKRLMEEAIKAEQEGDEDKMDAMLDIASLVETAPPPVMETVQAAGTHTRKTLDFRVLDPTKVPAYMNGIQLRKIDEPAIRALLKLGVTNIPGIEVYEKEMLVLR